MTLRIVLVDDEAPARWRLRQLIAAIPEPHCEVVGEAADAATAAALLAGMAADAVLLDIRMPGRSGLQLADALRRQPLPPAVIFVTAHAEHALTAFDLEAVDYLTKPVRRERLQAALLRVAQRQPVAPAVDEAQALVVSDRGRVLRIPVAELVYLRAEQKYVTLRTAAASYLLDDALAELEQRLGDRVVRIHRNALVARHAVRALERHGTPQPGADDGEAAGDGVGWAVQVAPTGEWLAVSRRQLPAVREALAPWA